MSGASILRTVGLLLPLTALAGETPTFTRSSVLPANATNPKPLQRLMLVSIYGRHLGPDSGCAAERAFSEPIELCGASVSIGGTKAALLYVQDKQINLRVPATAPTEGMVDFIVTYSGDSSAPVPIRFATLTASVKVSGPAYVHMPIWVDVDLPDPHWRSLRYPVRIYPADFGGHQFEIRRNGVVVPQLKPVHPAARFANGLSSYGMIGGGGLLGLPHEPKNSSRLPLHLIYRFDSPGLYDILYTGQDVDGQVLVHSSWFRFEVKDFASSKRDEWIAVMRQTAPSDPVELLSDFLPSLLAVPDNKVLSVLEEYLYNANSLVRQYTLNALNAFDDDLLSMEIPRLVDKRGPTNELAYLLSWRRNQFQAQGPALVRAALNYLDSPSPLLSGGALQTLYFLKAHYDWKPNPAMPARMNDEVSKRAELLLETRNRDILQPLALYLGNWKADRSRDLLWRMVEEGTTREQALICLTWIADPRDLPKLAKYNTGNLNYHLNRAYGAAAARYLK